MYYLSKIGAYLYATIVTIGHLATRQFTWRICQVYKRLVNKIFLYNEPENELFWQIYATRHIKCLQKLFNVF